MKIEPLIKKTEPEGEIINTHYSNDFEYGTSQNGVKTEVEYLPTFNNEDSNESFNCKNETFDSFNNEETILKPPQMQIDDIFDEEDLVDVSKLKYLLNQSENMPECSNIKYQDKNFNTNSTVGIKKEEQDCDILEDALQLSDFSSEENEHKISKDYEDQRSLEPKEEEPKTDTKSKIHLCSICSYQTTVRSNLVRHLNRVHSNVKIELNCQFCGKSFAYKYSLEDHLLKQHKGEIKGELKSFITNKILKCNFCCFETTLTNSLNVHINAMHNEERIKIHCQFCNKSFTFKTAFEDHLLKQHKTEIQNDINSFITTKILTCNLCNFETTLTGSINAHIHSTHNKQRIKCEFCDKSFSRQMSQDDHLLKNHKDEINQIKTKIHNCHICSYKSTYKHLLRQHVNLVHNDNKQRSKINCQFCDKSFARKYALEDHLLKQHKNEISSNTNYTITSKIHACHICTYTTTNKNTLSRHIDSTHNKIRIKKQCQFCNKSFSSRIALDNHLLKQHTTEINSDTKCFIKSKIHKCHSCDYETTITNNLNVHINTVHKEQRTINKCHFCDRSFASQTGLDDHLLKQHKDEINNVKSKIHKCNNCAYETTFKHCLDKHKCQSQL